MTVKGTIDTIAFGGCGILRKDGLVVFVPFTAPDELVEVKILEEKKQFAKARLLRIIDSSPERKVPPCDHFGTCGGCQLQHIRYEKQLQIKKKFVQDALARIGKLAHIPAFQIIEASKPYRYRNHITLQITNERFGYSSHWDNTWLPIHHCPIFDAEESFFRHDLPAFLRALNPPNTHLKIIKAASDQYVFSFYSALAPLAADILEKFPFCQGIQAQGKCIAGNTTICRQMLGINLEYTPDFFMQNYIEQAENLYRYILSQAIGSGQALDLYCGLGITSFLLAEKGYQTTGVELNHAAIQQANKLILHNPNIPAPEFIEGDCSLETKKFTKSLDLVLVNPPKTGLSEQLIASLQAKKPRRIIYTSCMPATLARDLAKLTTQYKLSALQSFDMFPETTHLETVAVLDL